MVIPDKIEETFIQIAIDYEGEITEIAAGKFALQEFKPNSSIFITCPFLEATIDAIPLREFFRIEGMVISFLSTEFNIDVELYKDEHSITVLILNQTNVYKSIKELNQKKNEISIAKNQIDSQNKKLEQLRIIADRANEEKSRFLAVVSHEIRNPLNSILGYADLIASENTDPKIKDHIKLLLMAGNNLKVIVSDILNLSRIEAGKLELAVEPISIEEIIKVRVKNHKLKNSDSNIQLNYSISDKLPKKVLGDSVRVTQILSNLISNSFKFTKEGSITVKADLISEKKDSVIINFCVKDSGRGMSTEQIKKIFNEYEQTELNDSRLFQGAGLGLSIVKRLVEAMSGEISVESKLNVGATFNIKIPFQKVDAHADAEVVKSGTIDQNIDLNGLEILYADDDKLNHEIAAHLLSKAGVSTTLVNDGLEALSTLKKKKFDIVLLDIQMPNMSGEEVIEQKQLFTKYNAATPIVALTASTGKADIERYINLGFVSVISKPYTENELKTAIGSVVKNRF